MLGSVEEWERESSTKIRWCVPKVASRMRIKRFGSLARSSTDETSRRLNSWTALAKKLGMMSRTSTPWSLRA